MLQAFFLLYIFSGHIEFSGQLSGQIGAFEGALDSPRLRALYLPEWSFSQELQNKLNMDVLVTLSSEANVWREDAWKTDLHSSLYRGWIRMGSERTEFRLGLQKINFGAASILRPLMWFDRVDPRDPQKLTEGVKGGLLRHYFQNNGTFWIWGLYGNHETKGWEMVPGKKNTPEWGGRFQTPVGQGEAAMTFHQRDISQSELLEYQEERFGLDGKWDLGIGIWLESSWVRQSKSAQANYTRMTTFGLDYTFSNGITAMLESMNTQILEHPTDWDSGFDVTVLSLSYAISFLDQITALLYFDWEQHQWFRFANWTRTYDNFQLITMAFWNDDFSAGTFSSNLYSGKGIQFQIVYNH